MPWLRIDDELFLHPKWIATPPVARALWVTALSYAGKFYTGGRIHPALLPMLGGSVEDAEALVQSGLWEKHEADYVIHDFEKYNESSTPESKTQLSEARAEAGRIGGQRSAEVRRSKNEANGKQTPSKSNQNEAPVPDPGPHTQTQLTTAFAVEKHADASKIAEEAAVVDSVDSGEKLDGLSAFGDVDDPLPRVPRLPEQPLEIERVEEDPCLPPECAPLDGVLVRPSGGRSFDWKRIAIALRKRRIPGDKSRAADAEYVAARLEEWAKNPATAPLVRRLEQELANREMEEPARYARTVVDAWSQSPPTDRKAAWGQSGGQSPPSEAVFGPGYHQEARVDQDRVNDAYQKQEQERLDREERIRQRMEADGVDPNAPFTGSVKELLGMGRRGPGTGLRRVFEARDEAQA